MTKKWKNSGANSLGLVRCEFLHSNSSIVSHMSCYYDFWDSFSPFPFEVSALRSPTSPRTSPYWITHRGALPLDPIRGYAALRLPGLFFSLFLSLFFSFLFLSFIHTIYKKTQETQITLVFWIEPTRWSCSTPTLPKVQHVRVGTYTYTSYVYVHALTPTRTTYTYLHL